MIGTFSILPEAGRGAVRGANGGGGSWPAARLQPIARVSRGVTDTCPPAGSH